VQHRFLDASPNWGGTSNFVGSQLIFEVVDSYRIDVKGFSGRQSLQRRISLLLARGELTGKGQCAVGKCANVGSSAAQHEKSSCQLDEAGGQSASRCGCVVLHHCGNGDT
jgi:hypothetical protein